MRRVGGRSGTASVTVGGTVLTVLAVLPDRVAAQSVDPTVVMDAPAPLRAAAAFVLVLAFGGAILYLRERGVNAAVDASMGRPLQSAVYGVALHGLVVFATGYLYTQLIQLAGRGSLLFTAGIVAVGVVWLGLAGVGYAVVGAYLLELLSYRQLWPGLALGAAIAGVVALLSPFVLALAVWVGVVSLGIGGPMRQWLHASEADVEGARG